MASFGSILKGIGSYIAGNAAAGATSLIPGGQTLAPAVQAGVTKGVHSYLNGPNQGATNAMGNSINPNGLTQISNFNPQQQQLQSAAGNEALRLLQGGQPTGFQPIADQARANFQTKTVPSLAERFGGQGNERGSSALYGQLSGAGAELDRGLAALQSQYGQNQLKTLLGAGLKPSSTFLNDEQGPGAFEQFAGDTASWLPKLFQAYMDLKQQSGQPASEEEWQQVVQQFGQNQQQDTGSIVSRAQQNAFSSQQSPLFGSSQYQLGGRA